MVHFAKYGAELLNYLFHLWRHLYLIAGVIVLLTLR
jgi:hypothetical protein